MPGKGCVPLGGVTIARKYETDLRSGDLRERDVGNFGSLWSSHMGNEGLKKVNRLTYMQTLESTEGSFRVLKNI